MNRFGIPSRDEKPSAQERQALLLIEHGQTPFDIEGRVHGGLDPRLTDQGRDEARELGGKLKAMARSPDVLYSSDRKRAAETARIAGRIAGIPVRLAPELRPLDVGEFSGQDEKAVAAKLKPYFAMPWREIPGGDRVSSWRAKHMNFAKAVAEKAKRRGILPGFVTHSNVIGSIAAKATGKADGRNAMANPPKSASIHRVEYPLGVSGRTSVKEA